MEPLAAKAEVPKARRSALTEGARAPAFRLPRDGGDSVSLSDIIPIGADERDALQLVS